MLRAVKRLLVARCVGVFAACATTPASAAGSDALEGGAKRRSRKSKNPNKHDAPGTIVLNGDVTEVVWSDGDSFNIKSGRYEGRGTRLQGYNTLEAYGPVHRWGDWTAQELYELAKASSHVAAATSWKCTTDGKEDGYKRLLIDCPDLAIEMARAGHGLAYSVEHAAEASPALLAAQKEAQVARRGMWAKGVTNGVITSLHSVGEDGETESQAYNRVVDTRTGAALVRKHTSAYKTCEEVCETTDGQTSCMIYVPFKIRYRNQPDCLK